MANVLLLRSPTADGPDKYEAALRDAGYHPLSIPVLETVLVNLDDLQQLVKSGPRVHDFSGVIITSARSCEAWREVVQTLVSGESPTAADWTSTPFYVVGQATAAALEQIADVPGSTTLAPRDIRGGNESGTAEKLAHFILQDLPRDGSRKLLYLTGDKNRETLPKILQDGGLDLHPLQVYKTQGSSSFAVELQAALDSLPNRSDKWWIVYFAPSAADFVTPILRKHFAIPGSNDERASTRVAAIGPTTSTFLVDELHIRVDVLSPKPNPESLALAIKHFDNAHFDNA